MKNDPTAARATVFHSHFDRSGGTWVTEIGQSFVETSLFFGQTRSKYLNLQLPYVLLCHFKVVQRSSCQNLLVYTTIFCHTGSPRVSSACNAEGSKLDLKNVPWYSATPLNTNSKHLESTDVRILWKNACHTSHISHLTEKKTAKVSVSAILVTRFPDPCMAAEQPLPPSPGHSPTAPPHQLSPEFPPPQPYHCAAHILSFPTTKLSHTFTFPRLSTDFCFISSTIG